MMKLLVLLLLTTFNFTHASASSDLQTTKSFLILKSTKFYKEANSAANEASEKLKLKLDLRDLTPNPETGLTFDKKVCLEGPMQKHPCYNPRGKYDDGDYISIEYSDAYPEFKAGYYIVVAYSGDSSNAGLVLKRSKTKFKDAYIKRIKIYMAGE